MSLIGVEAVRGRGEQKSGVVYIYADATDAANDVLSFLFVFFVVCME